MNEDELSELESLVRRGGSIGLRLEQGLDGRAYVRPDEAALEAHAAVPRLVAEVRRLRGALATLEKERQRLADAAQARAAGSREAASPRKVAPGPPEADPPRGPVAGEIAEELATLLSAPFRVSPEAQSRAKTDPLAALAIQVAKALGEGAAEVERARLLAMAFAASEGDVAGLWEARRRRGAKKSGSK